MAEVYKGYNPDLDRYVAIKVLHTFMAEKTGILGRFQREAKNIAAMSHPNIVQVYDFSEAGDNYFMVMEYIDGITLKQHARALSEQGQGISMDESVRVVSDVGRALAYAHEKGVVHRDVKPGNIMIDSSGRVVLTDFGLARVISNPQLTATGAIIGTPAYIPPEQGLGQPGDARSDIYSLGAVLYQLLTGTLPFRAETPIAIVYKHINAPLPSPTKLNPEIPPALESVLLKAMDKDPDNRYQDAERFVDALQDIPLLENPDWMTGNVALERRLAPDISIHIVQTGDIMPLKDKKRYILGRTDETVVPDVDLSPYDGIKNGVSRVHAEITLDHESRVFLTDLNSTNGTWVNGLRIEKQNQVPLNHGDVISLGKLVVQALIYT